MKSMEVKTNDAVSFGVHFVTTPNSTFCHPDEDDKGLKLEKVGKLFQVWMRFISKVPKR